MRAGIVVAMNDVFKNEGPALIEQLRHSYGSDDRVSFLKAIHGLTGAARRIGAGKLKEFCQGVESQAIKSPDDSLPSFDMVVLEELFWEAYYAANKTGLDQRVEAIETAISMMNGSLGEHMQEQATATKELTTTIKAEFKTMVEALTGKDQMPTKVVVQLTRIYGVIIMGLVIIMVAMLTGIKMGWISNFAGG